jgi:dipeptidyl aminopeptidase/acylaminoacyl peptidase
VDLGIFEPVAGRIVYYADSSLWGVDPNASSPGSTLVRLDLGGTADADRFASFTLPLGWSSDGTKLLFLREDPTDSTFPYDRYLYILHSDGTETQVIPEPVEGAAISPDGSRVAFAADGLYVVDAEGGQPVRIAEEGNSPTFSPDGTQIAYLSLPRDGCCVQTGREHVWVANADGTGAHEILADEPALAKGVFELTWSPAGDRIAMANSLERRVAIYTFAPDGSDFTEVNTGGMNPFWSPDGSQIAYLDNGLSIADADGSNVRTLGVGDPGPWHPGAGGEGEDFLDPTPSGFVGGWAATDYNDHSGGLDPTPSQTMTIRAGEDGVLHITVDDDSACEPDDTAQTMTGTGRLEDPTTLVVPTPDLTCVEGSVEASDRVDIFDGYTLVLDPATDRLYDSLGVVWIRGALADSWTGAPTEDGPDGPGTFSILHGEVTFRAAEPWNDHFESYIDPRTFFLVGLGGQGADESAEMTLLVNPLPPEAPCGRHVPPSAEELVQAVRSNPDLETTEPVIERVGGIDALRMDVVATPGASVGPCTAGDAVDVVSVPGRPWANVGLGELGRLYVLDLPGGSARTLAILITAPDAAVFEQALNAAASVLNSFEFHAP